MRIRAVTILLLLFALGRAAAGETPAPDELRRMLSEIGESRRIQTEPPERPRQSGNEAERGGDRWRSPGDSWTGGSASGPAIPPDTANIMLWIALTVLLATVLWTLRDVLAPYAAGPGRRGDRRPKDGAPVRERMNVVRLEGDELAAGGDYASAMHLLLLRSVEEMRRRLNAPIAASLTSREILARAALGPEAKEAFADIVAGVEVSRFGGRVPGEEEYAHCRRRFSLLTRALAGEDGA